MNDDVPNFRGGPSSWLIFVIGPLLGAIVTAAGAVWAIARMPDGTQFREVTRDVSAIKESLARFREHQDQGEKLIDERFENLKLLIKQDRRK